MMGGRESATVLMKRPRANQVAHIYPSGGRFYLEAQRVGPWSVYPIVGQLEPLVRALGLRNMWRRVKEVRNGPPTLNMRCAARSWGATRWRSRSLTARHSIGAIGR